MSLDLDAQLLSGLSVFQNLEPEAIRLLAFQAESRDFSVGEAVFQFGQKADGGIIIVSGAIALTETRQDDGEPRIVGKGALLGQLALITEVTHRAEARAIEQTTILAISRSAFRKLLREYPGSAAKLRAAIATELREFTRELAQSRQIEQ